jgi:hypothetical protein
MSNTVLHLKLVKCRHCGQSFEPRPDKKGFINECPECEGQRYRTIEAPSQEGADRWDWAKHKKKRRKPQPMSKFRRLMRDIDRKQKERAKEAKERAKERAQKRKQQRVKPMNLEDAKKRFPAAFRELQSWLARR